MKFKIEICELTPEGGYTTYCTFRIFPNFIIYQFQKILLFRITFLNFRYGWGNFYINKNIKLLALKERLIQMSFMKNSIAKINAMSIIIKRLIFTESILRSRTITKK